MSSKINVNYNLLKISQNPIAPYVIAAFSMVYGAELQEIIKDRINKNLFLHYVNLEGIKDYVNYLKSCKSKELAVEFLRRIGYKVPEKNSLNYADDFEEKLECLIDNYLGTSNQAFNRGINSPTIPLKLVKVKNLNNENKIKKVKLINQIRDNKNDLITTEVLKKFEDTDEYKKILDLISVFEDIYDEMLEEFKKWEKSLKYYDNYIREESRRKKLILNKNGNELYNKVLEMLPKALKEKIESLAFNERTAFILGEDFTENKSIFEAFSKKNMTSLYDEDSPLYEKYWIVNEQINFLKSLGIDVPVEEILGCSCHEDVQEYIDFLERDDILIPDATVCENIASLHKDTSEETIKEFYYTSEAFLKLVKHFYNDEKTKEYFYKTIKKRKIFVSAFLKYDSLKNCNTIESFLCYTVGLKSGGSLAYALLHEFGHVIDYSKNGCGFENIDDLSENGNGNSYDKRYRYYERFNEALNDIFTLEAIKILNEKEVYLLEEKSLTSKQLEDINTSKIIKDLIRPLLEKYRSYVTDVKVTADKNRLTDFVGEKNFENLVDAVNKVDYLVSMGLREMLAIGRETNVVKEYYRELDRVSDIYVKMDEYYSYQVGNLGEVNHYKKNIV